MKKLLLGIIALVTLQFCNAQNVGIGTTNPQAKLDVNGSFKLGNGVTVNNISSNINLSPGDDNTLPTQNAVMQYIKNGSWIPTTGAVPFSITPKDFLNNNLSQPQSVYVQGNYAYVASAGNNSLAIFDISAPQNIVALGVTSTNLNNPQSVFVSGNYAYVASTGNSRLCIYDISNPNNIVARGFISTNLTTPKSVYVLGNYAYVASASNNSLCIFNISNPTAIVATGFTTLNLSGPQSVIVQDNYAYVISTNNNRLCIFDISNPASITSAGTTQTNLAQPQSVFVKGNYAYVASLGNSRLCIFDISNPSSIVAKNNIISPIPESVYVQGNLAYVVSSGSNTLNIFDINDPNNILSKATTSTNLSSPQSVFALGNYAYVVSSVTNNLSVYLVGEITGNHTLSLDPGGNIVAVPSFWQTDGNNNVYRVTGNVGIGTATPTAKLQIAGDIKINGQTLELGAAGISKEVNSGKIGYQLFTANTLDITGAGISAGARKIKFWNDGGANFTGNVGIGAVANANKLNVAGNANIDSLGIGTIDPVNRLSVVGKANIDSLGIGTSNPANKLSVAGIANIDSLGIGIATPSASFDVKGTTLFRGNNTNSISSPIAGVEFFTGRSSTGALVPGQTTADIAFNYGGTGGGYRHFISTKHNNAASSPNNSIDFYVNNSSTANGSSAPGTGNVLSLSVNATGVTVQDTLFVPHIKQDANTLATLQNGWVNNGGIVELVSFYKDKEERVYLSGTMRFGNTGSGITLFILPVGYRPALSEFFSVHNSNTTAQIRVDSNGVVSLFGNASNNSGLSMSGISFRAAN